MSNETHGEICEYCGFCKTPIYIKKERILQPIMKPLTETGAIEQRLPFEYLRVPKIYCPICGKRLLEENNAVDQCKR